MKPWPVAVYGLLRTLLFLGAISPGTEQRAWRRILDYRNNQFPGTR